MYVDLAVQWEGGIYIFIYDSCELNYPSLDNLSINIAMTCTCQSTYIQARPPYFYLIVIRGYEIA
jgi:hypothetical protein